LTGNDKYERFKGSKWNQDLTKELSGEEHRYSVEVVNAEKRVCSKVDSSLNRCLKTSEMVQFLNSGGDDGVEEYSQKNS
jgi:hypothetical protein